MKIGLRLSQHVGLPLNGNLLLDEFSGASAAYSVRKLSSSYPGNCIRVRRSSDSAESDIGFDSNNNLDESALTAFIGANDGLIVTWYDQSGNGNDATQSTTSRQPRIVSAGTIDKDGGIPCIRGVSNDYLDMNYYIPKLASSFCVGRCDTTNDIIYGAFNSTDSYAHFFGAGSGGAYDAGYGNALFAAPDSSGGVVFTEKFIVSNVGNNTTMRTLINDVNDFTQTPSTVNEAATPASNYGYILANNAGGAGFYTTGLIQELVIYEADKQSDSSAIISALNDYYSVY